MSNDDLWQSEPTIIKPSPGGARRAANQKPAGETTTLFTALRRNRRGEGDEIDFNASGMPYIVSSARPLLNLLDRLRGMTTAPDVNQLHKAVLDELNAYKRNLANASVDMDHARVAHYIMCATIDDVVLATDWGSNSMWRSQSVLSHFHRDVRGGEYFYEMLEDRHRDPGTNRDLLMLFYLCLSLGFKGRLRRNTHTALELSNIRDSLYRTLKNTMGDLERELSPNWRGVNARNPAGGFRHLLPAFLGLCLLAAIGLYLLLLNLLNDRSDIAIVDYRALPPVGKASIFVEVPVEEPVEQRDTINDFTIFLQQYVDAGLVTTTRDGNEVLVLFRNRTGYFDTGSAQVKPDFAELIANVSQEINKGGFEVVITGYTDNVPMNRTTGPFRSNQELSHGRAKAVEEIVTRYVPAERVRAEGRGESNPINTNDTPEGRQANRRIEMIVTYVPSTDPNIIIQGPGQPQ